MAVDSMLVPLPSGMVIIGGVNGFRNIYKYDPGTSQILLKAQMATYRKHGAAAAVYARELQCSTP